MFCKGTWIPSEGAKEKVDSTKNTQLSPTHVEHSANLVSGIEAIIAFQHFLNVKLILLIYNECIIYSILFQKFNDFKHLQ